MARPELETQLDPLSRLAIRYGTDKFGAHLYTPAYHNLLQHLRERPVRLLEIGVGGYNEPQCGGASLRMWAAYFPAGQITGLDFNQKSIDISPRVAVLQGSQDDPACLLKLHREHGPFDVVIDDGSHLPHHMITSFLNLYPLLKPDGFYLIEDTQTSFIEGFGGNPAGAGTIYTLAHQLTLQMQRAEGFVPAAGELDLQAIAAVTSSVNFLRNVICFCRGDNTYPSNAKFDLAAPQVAAVYALIEQEAVRNPAPRNVLSRIEMSYCAREFDRAAALAEAALAQFPNNVNMMREMLFILRRMNRPEIIAALEVRIAALGA